MNIKMMLPLLLCILVGTMPLTLRADEFNDLTALTLRHDYWLDACR